MAFGRANNTGRSTNKHNGARAKRLSPPPYDDCGGWVWHTRELLLSPAWRLQSLYCRRFIDYLEIEHCAHAGQENGALRATYDQLVQYGLLRKKIRDAIKEAVFLGLVRVTEYGGRWNGSNKASLYRLTYLGTIDGMDATGPTNEWSGVTIDAIQLWHTRGRTQRQRRARKKHNGSSHGGTTVVPTGVTTNGPTLKLIATETAEIRHS